MKDVLKEYLWINIITYLILFILSMAVYLNIKNRFDRTSGLEKEVEDQNKAFKVIFEKASDGVLIFENDNIIECNEAIVEMLGYEDRTEIIGKHSIDISPDMQPDGSSSRKKAEYMFNIAIDYGVNNFEWKHKRADGGEFWTGVTLTCITLSDKVILHALLKDITLQKDMEEELRNEQALLNYKANHDLLTMLPNRSLFNDRLIQSIKTAQRHNNIFAVMFIDLDEFKPINDSLGHQVGDKVLQEVSKRLKDHVREEDTIARLGGDEFTIIMQNLKVPNDASVLAGKIVNALSEEMNIDEHKIKLSASIGISLFPENSTDPDQLISQADIAMYKAKSDGRNHFQFYEK